MYKFCPSGVFHLGLCFSFFKLFAVIQVNIIRILLLIKRRKFGGTLRLRLNWVWQPWFKETQELNCKWVVFYWSFVWLFSSPTGLCNMNLSARVRLSLQWDPDLNCGHANTTFRLISPISQIPKQLLCTLEEIQHTSHGNKRGTEQDLREI